jgi:hypothetical protein
MEWVKQGLIFAPPAGLTWMKNYASVPCALATGDSRYRIYFTGRDEGNRSHVGFFDMEMEPVPRVVHVAPDPVLAPGELGAFDDSGAMCSCVLAHRNRVYLYYIGWNLGRTVPFSNSVGLAVSQDGGRTFERASRGPVIPRDDVDPFFTASSWVMIENGLWRMWYLSCCRWEVAEGGKPKHFYHIKYAVSTDGLRWAKDGLVCIDFHSPDEYAISRPSILRATNGKYRMWYSHRGDRYRIGYAESADGLVWERMDAQAGIEPSESGWDSEMIEYPCVFTAGQTTYLLYNGNDYGRTGIGLAILQGE